VDYPNAVTLYILVKMAISVILASPDAAEVGSSVQLRQIAQAPRGSLE
jgi:hypothetical protein